MMIPRVDAPDEPACLARLRPAYLRRLQGFISSHYDDDTAL